MTTGANPSAESYFDGSGGWQPVVRELRRILLDCDLDEEVKWGKPCYTTDDGNIAIIQNFKDYCAVLYPKGALLDDPVGLLVAMTENVQAARQIRFRDLNDVLDHEPDIRTFTAQAVANEAAGLQVPMKDTADFVMVEEFAERLASMPELAEAFEALTPGRQRAYLLHFSGAKQSKTRAARVERNIQRILDGKGLND